MTKRKDSEDEPPFPNESSSSESSSDNETDMLDVEFEWFDPQPDHDFHGLKTLLRQLFDVDAQLFDLGMLANLVLAQPLLGSTVKLDGNETDPYAFLTVLNLQKHMDNQVIKTLVNYIIQRSATNSDLLPLQSLLTPSSEARVGLVLSERLINIPSEVVPPMYNMLIEEISWALEEQEPYDFSHYLVLSKTYQEVESKLDTDTAKPRARKKQKSTAIQATGSPVFFFHPEDEVLQRHSQTHGSFEYSNQQGEGQADAKRTFQDFGIKPQGHMILIEAKDFKPAVIGMEKYFS